MRYREWKWIGGESAPKVLAECRESADERGSEGAVWIQFWNKLDDVERVH